MLLLVQTYQVSDLLKSKEARSVTYILRLHSKYLLELPCDAELFSVFAEPLVLKKNKHYVPAAIIIWINTAKLLQI